MKIESIPQVNHLGLIHGKLAEEEHATHLKSYDEVQHLSHLQRQQQQREEPTCLSTLFYTKLHPLSKRIECNFFKTAMKKQPAFEKIEFFHIEPNPQNTTTTDTVTSRAFIAQNECMSFIEAQRPIEMKNKESLSTLLDLVDEYGCEKMYACVEREEKNMKEIVQSYMAVGFRLDHSLVLPGYLLLLLDF
ncbi:hypothetical protein PROFUN_10176 [Planoprotostelium fungivorum]|uniref:Ornithine decarboxylase antizyme n=1 Tax=Planoprotostelium fungivorum TaxID=1890364 RepID=A0A2P6NEM3_9EUKA|nr:hypothetical protein PROFUN_10176 [Planoprotostelium fungivorum]